MQKSQILAPRHRRLRGAVSCRECRRRKQKVACIDRTFIGALADSIQCIRAKDGPCANCLRRYPPVECVFKSDLRSGSNIPHDLGMQWSKTREVFKSISGPAARSSLSSPGLRIPLDQTSGTSHHGLPSSSESESSAVSTSISRPDLGSTIGRTDELKCDTGGISSQPTVELKLQSLQPCSKETCSNPIPSLANSVPFGVILYDSNIKNGATVNTSRRNAD